MSQWVMSYGDQSIAIAGNHVHRDYAYRTWDQGVFGKVLTVLFVEKASGQC
jgi:hypothetical protein